MSGRVILCASQPVALLTSSVPTLEEDIKKKDGLGMLELTEDDMGDASY